MHVYIIFCDFNDTLFRLANWNWIQAFESIDSCTEYLVMYKTDRDAIFLYFEKLFENVLRTVVNSKVTYPTGLA